MHKLLLLAFAIISLNASAQDVLESHCDKCTVDQAKQYAADVMAAAGVKLIVVDTIDQQVFFTGATQGVQPYLVSFRLLDGNYRLEGITGPLTAIVKTAEYLLNRSLPANSGTYFKTLASYGATKYFLQLSNSSEGYLLRVF